MRNFTEIIEELKSGGNPDYEELKYAFLTYIRIMEANKIKKYY